MAGVNEPPVMAGVNEPPALHPQIENLLQEVESFNEQTNILPIQPTNLNFADIVSQANALVDMTLHWLLEWRKRANYPGLRANENDANILNSFQRLFCKLQESLFNYQNGLGMCVDNGGDVDDSVNKLAELRNKLICKAWIVESNPCQTNKMGKSKTAGVSEEPVRVQFRCLLPGPCSPELQFVVRDLEPSRETCTARLDNLNVTRGTTNSTLYQWNIVTLVSGMTRVKPMKKLDANLYVIQGIYQRKVVVETLPFGFYTHTTQIPILSGHILWFNAFSVAKDPCLTLQASPASANIASVLSVLNEEFHGHDSVLLKSMKSTNKPKKSEQRIRLNDYNNTCLAEMMGVRLTTPTDVFKDAFLKKKIDHEKKVTFWEWFYACCKTKCEYLPQLYQQGLLYGFVTKDHACEILQRQSISEAPETKMFILRFSTKYLDGNHAYISPSIMRTRGQTDHGNPIKANKYKCEEQKLGRVLLTEMGEIEHSNLKIITLPSNSLRTFDEAFKDFMEETEVFTGYEDLNRDSIRSSSSMVSAPSPSPSDISIRGASTTIAAQQIEDFLQATGSVSSVDTLPIFVDSPLPSFGESFTQGLDMYPATPSQVNNGSEPMDMNMDGFELERVFEQL